MKSDEFKGSGTVGVSAEGQEVKDSGIETAPDEFVVKTATAIMDKYDDAFKELAK
ncbi:MAG: hypothetical protein VZQ80_09345 [Lachnospiraceae bacterium]|nr:hypothetical protein [Lachnospiraceae bacterium]